MTSKKNQKKFQVLKTEEAKAIKGGKDGEVKFNAHERTRKCGRVSL